MPRPAWANSWLGPRSPATPASLSTYPRAFAELAVEPARHDRLAHRVGRAAAVGDLGLVDELLREAERHLEHARAQLRARHDLGLLQRGGQCRQHALLAVGGEREGRVAARRDDVAHGRAERRGVAGCA